MNTNFSDKVKQSYLDKTIVNKTKLLLKNRKSNDILETMTENDYVKSWEYTCERYVPNHGFIGEFVSRTLSCDLHRTIRNRQLEDGNIELIIGSVVDFKKPTEETEWTTLGTFVISEITEDSVNDNVHVEAFDLGTLFNERFNPNYTNDVFIKSFSQTIKDGGSFTAEQLAKYVCAQVGVIFGNTSGFTNSNFTINQNPYVDNSTCRDVIKDISKLAYGFAEIAWNDKCYIRAIPTSLNSKPIDNYHTLTPNEYYSLNAQQKQYGPINVVTIGIKDVEGESVTIDNAGLINTYGVREICIWDNPLTYTPELRLAAIDKGEVLFNVSYVPMKCETVGLPWLDANSMIKIGKLNKAWVITIPFNCTIKYNGCLTSTIEAPAKTKTEESVGYDKSVYQELLNTRFVVDKANGAINALVQSTEDISGRVNETNSKVDASIASFDDFKNNEYIKSIENLQTQIDGAIQFWNGKEIPVLTNYPANQWISEDDKNNHRADIYTVIDDTTNKQGKSYRFDKVGNEWKWIELTDNELSAVQKLAQDALDKANANVETIKAVEEKTSDLSISNNEIRASVSDVTKKLNNEYTNTSGLNQKLEQQKQELSEEYKTSIAETSKQISFEVLHSINENGVESLKNTLVTINDAGVNVSKSDESVKSLLDNKGIYVSDGIRRVDDSNVLMKVDKSGGYMKTIRITGTIKENECIQKERTHDSKYGKCQTWYWIG